MFEWLLTLLNKLPYGSGTVVEAPKPEPKQVFPDYIPPVQSVPVELDEHAVRVKELEDLYIKAKISQIPGTLLSGLHQRTREDRRHREILEELRRGRE